MHLDDEKTFLVLAAWAAAIFVVVFSIALWGCGGIRIPRTCIEVGASDAGSDH